METMKVTARGIGATKKGRKIVPASVRNRLKELLETIPIGEHVVVENVPVNSVRSYIAKFSGYMKAKFSTSVEGTTMKIARLS